MEPEQDSGRKNDVRVDACEASVYQRLVSEFASILLVICQPDGTPVAEWVGEEVAGISGYTVAELEADPNLWMGIVHPADQERLRSACNCLAEGKHAREEYRIYRKDGQMRWVGDTGATASVGPDGLVRSIHCMTDITTARSVGQWQIDFKELVEETPVGVIVRDTTGRLLYCNQAAARIYGRVSRDELLGTRVEDIIHPDFGKRFREEVFPKLLSGPWSREVPIKRQDGTVVYVTAGANQFRDNEGRVVAVYSILSDITDLKETEAALRDSQDLLTAVRDSLPANLAVIDATGTIIATNERWKRFSRENGEPDLTRTCEGANYLDVCRQATGEDAAEAAEALAGLNSLLNGEISELEMEYPCAPAGGYRWFVMRAAALGEQMGGAVIAHIDITQSKLAEQAVRESEAKYHSLVENLDAVVFRIDANLHPIALSGSLEKLSGYTAEEIEKHPALLGESIHPDDMGKTWERLQMAEALRVPQAVELRIRHRTGVTKWIRGTLTPIFDERGRLLWFDGVLLDITDRRAAEEAAKESQERYKSLVDSLDAVIFRTDARNVPIALYGRVAELTGYTLTEFMQDEQLWTNIVCPDDREHMRESFGKLAATGERGAIEMRIVRKSGEVRWVRAHVMPRYGEHGDLLCFDGVGLDITEHKALEEARGESEERYRSLVDSLDAVIFRANLDNVPVVLYGRVAEQSGYTSQELMEDPQLWTNLLHPDDRERVLQFYRKEAGSRGRHAIEMRIVCKSGAVRWVRTHVTPRYDERGKLLSFDGVSLDVTESVEAKHREARRTARMGIITDLSQALASSLDTRQILDTATKRLCETLEAISVGITLEPSTGRISNLSICCPRGCEIETMDRAIRRPEVTVDEVFGEGGVTPRLAPDIRQVSKIAAKLADAAKAAGLAELGPAMLAPVTAGTDALGALFSARPQGREFDQEDLWFATEVASHASSALANATLYSQKARIAENLQRGLIPAEPSLKCLDIATLYSPAPGEAQVGGDFFDVFNFGCDKVGMVIGDVSGKGLDAAIHTAETKYMLRAFAHQNPDPVHAVSCLNDALYHYLPHETFVTLVYLLINACGHSLTYVNAGHEPCLVRCRDGGVFREIKPGGPLLGVTQSASYVAGEARLEPDDALFCYTDGIVEVRRDGEQFGYQRLCEALSDAPPGDSRAIMEYVMDRVRGFGAAKQTDDQVVVVVRPLL